MKYNDTRSEIVAGTKVFDVPGIYIDQSPVWESTNQHHAGTGNSRENNGRTKLFVITIDPQRLYTLGVSSFTLADVTLGIRNGTFSEGTEFMSPTGRVRIMGGKLKYTKNKALYKLSEMRA